MRKSFFWLALAGALGLGGCSQNGIPLGFKFASGDTSSYRVSTTVITIATTGETSNTYRTTLTFILRRSVERLEGAGDGWLNFTYDSVTYQTNDRNFASPDQIEQLKKVNMVLKLATTGEILGADGLEQLPTLVSSDFNFYKTLIKAFPLFPKNRVSLNQSWDRQQEFPVENGILTGRMLVYKRYQLQDLQTVAGNQTATIDNNITIKFDLPRDREKAFKVTPLGSETLGIIGKGKIKFDVTRGDVLETKAYISGKLQIEMTHPISKELIRTTLQITQSIKIDRI